MELYKESKKDSRLWCWESAFDKGVIEGLCPVCHGGTIRYTSTSGTTFQKMHIIPESHGGPNKSWNLVPGCGCNQNMSQYNLIDWMGTKGNKRSLIRPLFLRKYKSMVAPCNRSPHNRQQLLTWVIEKYNPFYIEDYKDWLILLDRELASIQYDDNDDILVEEVKDDKDVSLSPLQVEGKVVSPYFMKKKVVVK